MDNHSKSKKKKKKKIDFKLFLAALAIAAAAAANQKKKNNPQNFMNNFFKHLIICLINSKKIKIKNKKESFEYVCKRKKKNKPENFSIYPGCCLFAYKLP